MVISGCIESVVYKNNDNNYTVLTLNVNNESITAVGKFPLINEGEWVECSGSFVKHSKYGEQFSVTSIKLTPPTSKEGIIRYLSSGLIYGVGPITATNIVRAFGEDTLDVIEFNPDKLSQVKGVSPKKAKEIFESFTSVKQMQNAVMLMQEYGITTNMAIKIFNAYGGKTENILRTNPYLLVEDIEGVGFYTADKIALEMGVKPDSEFRIRAGILHVLKENSDKSGNTYMFETDLKNELNKILRVEKNIDFATLDKIINKLIFDVRIKKLEKDDKTILMSTKLYNIEKLVSNNLKLLLCDQHNKIEIADDIALYETLAKIKMHDTQKQAVDMAVNSEISIITGGPGTGKTTIVKCILQIFNSVGKKVKLLAPTGRAAKKLSEATGVDASTIHRCLQVDYKSSNLFYYNNLNKLPYDVIVVDEVSMVDITLAYYLLRAVRRGTQIIFVGDKDQLASVGAGNFLADMLASSLIPFISLTQIYRQEENSLIITNAHDINNGIMPNLNNSNKDFFFDAKDVGEETLNAVVEMVTKRIPKFLNCDNTKIQVLAPMKAGVCGVDNLNKTLQGCLNPASINKAELQFGSTIFRKGDRVMQITNDYEQEWRKDYEVGSGVFNGDIGNIYSIDNQTGECVIEFEDGRLSTYKRDRLENLMLSYAITIHKSQGSEFECVIIPILSGAPMLLTRNLLYTAVTRAKQMVVLIGSKQVIARMIKNNFTKKRNTMLKDFLLSSDLM